MGGAPPAHVLRLCLASRRDQVQEVQAIGQRHAAELAVATAEVSHKGARIQELLDERHSLHQACRVNLLPPSMLPSIPPHWQICSMQAVPIMAQHEQQSGVVL